MRTLGTSESSFVLNKCRQLILNYRMEINLIDKNTTLGQDKIKKLQNKFIITLSGIMQILTEKDQAKLIETLDAFDMNLEIKMITHKLKSDITKASKESDELRHIANSISESSDLRTETDRLINSLIDYNTDKSKFKTFV